MEVTKEEERTGPNYMKLVQRFLYSMAKVGSNNDNNNNNNNNNRIKTNKQKNSLSLTFSQSTAKSQFCGAHIKY